MLGKATGSGVTDPKGGLQAVPWGLCSESCTPDSEICTPLWKGSASDPHTKTHKSTARPLKLFLSFLNPFLSSSVLSVPVLSVLLNDKKMEFEKNQLKKKGNH